MDISRDLKLAQTDPSSSTEMLGEPESEDVKAYKEAKAAIHRVLRHIRSARPRARFDLSTVASSEVKVGYLNNKPIQRVIMILRSSGCAWALENDGGCSMCGHIVGTTQGSSIDPEHLQHQFEERLKGYDFSKYPMLCLYNSGSFLNDQELPADVRRNILKKIAETKGIECVIIESRPDYVTSEVVSELEDYLGNRRVEIGIGLETISEEVRDLCLNKGNKTDEYKAAAAILSKSSVKFLAYVLVKPPFLLEMEAYIDAVKTIRFAFDIGADVISLEPVSVQDFTLVHYLYEAGQFRPPWIWTVFEVAKAIHNMGEIRLGGFEFMPVPKIFANNCNNCNEIMVSALEDFNRSSDISFLEGLTCECQYQWNNDRKQKSELVLAKRILHTLQQIESPQVIKLMKSNSLLQDDLQD